MYNKTKIKTLFFMVKMYLNKNHRLTDYYNKLNIIKKPRETMFDNL